MVTQSSGEKKITTCGNEGFCTLPVYSLSLVANEVFTVKCNVNAKTGETGLWVCDEPSSGPSSQCCGMWHHANSYWGKHTLQCDRLSTISTFCTALGKFRTGDLPYSLRLSLALIWLWESGIIFMLNLLCQLVRTAFSNADLELFSVMNSDLYMFPQMTVLPVTMIT